MTIEGSDKPSNIFEMYPTLNTERFYSQNGKNDGKHSQLKNEIKRLSQKLELMERMK